jgi:hypothetical protein
MSLESAFMAKRADSGRLREVAEPQQRRHVRCEAIELLDEVRKRGPR